jgi:hypothetical protein
MVPNLQLITGHPPAPGHEERVLGRGPNGLPVDAQAPHQPLADEHLLNELRLDCTLAVVLVA